MIQLHFHTVDDERINFEFYGHGTFQLDRDEIIVDPSILWFLLFNRIKRSDNVFYIPDTLLRLINKSQDNNEARGFLEKFLRFWGRPFNKPDEAISWQLFYENISNMGIKPITAEMIGAENEYYLEEYLKEFKNHKFYISLSPLTNMLGDCIGKMIELSKRMGFPIFSKTRKLTQLIQEKITLLEIPKKADNIIQAKNNYTNRLFDFQGGQATKFFIGIAIAIGGFANPFVGTAGVLFAFVDP